MKQSASEVSTVIDPVCGMQIDPENAVISSQWDGRTYHFCSRVCETRFDANPEQYIEETTVVPSCCSSGHSATDSRVPGRS